MANKEHVAIFVPKKVRNAIKAEAATKGLKIYEELAAKYNVKL